MSESSVSEIGFGDLGLGGREDGLAHLLHRLCVRTMLVRMSSMRLPIATDLVAHEAERFL